MSSEILTLAQLEAEYLSWLGREVAAGRSKPLTLKYYRDHLAAFRQSLGGDRRLDELFRIDLERFKTGWHSVQTVQRLFNWAQDFLDLDVNPFAKVERPAPGERERVLTRPEMLTLLRTASPAFRRFLIAMAHSLARPQEIRELRWGMLNEDESAFVLKEFKAKRRRKDGVRVRLVMVDGRFRRLLHRLRGREPHGPEDFVFLNAYGRPWTGNAIRCRMTRLRERCGLDQGGERIVCYTMRHSAATLATENGVRDKMLAALLGHSNTRTTARYQHPQPDALSDAIAQATRPRRRVS